MLERIRHYDDSRGINIECYTDGYAYNEYNEAFLVSLVGYDSPVKGIGAAFVSGREIEILSRDCVVSVCSCRAEKYRVLTAKLLSGLLHGIVAAETFFQEGTILYVTEGQSVEEVVYHRLQKTCTVPAIPAWAGWIYRNIADRGWVEELKGTTRVLRLAVEEKHLDALISEGIRNGEISFTKEDKCWNRSRT